MSELQSDYLTEADAPDSQEGNIKYAKGTDTTTYATAKNALTQKNTGWADSQDHQVGDLTIANSNIGAGTYVVTLSSDGKFKGEYKKSGSQVNYQYCCCAVPHPRDEGFCL